MSKTRTVNLTLELLAIPKERDHFRSFLSCEITDPQHKIFILFDALVNELPSKETWNRLYPESSYPADIYSNINYRKLEFKLSSYIEEYLAIQEFRQHKETRDIFLIKALNNRDSGKLFESKLKKIKGRLEKIAVRDESFYKTQYRLEREHQHHLYKQLLKAKSSIAPSLSKSFEIYWLHEQFRLAIANLNHERVTGVKVPQPFFKEVLKFSQEFGEEEYPVLYVYRMIYETLTGQAIHPDIASLIYKHQEKFRTDALKDIFATALNHYGRLFRSNPQILSKLFELYHWGVEDRLIFKDNILAWDYYKNYVTIGLHLKKYSLTREFIEKYKAYLPADHREDAYRFSLAQYYFTQNNFHQAIKLLNLKFYNVYHEIQARFLVLQAHYELSTDADLLRSLRSLRVFIGRQKSLSTNQKNQEINQVKFFEKLVKAYNKKTYDSLYAQIQEQNLLKNRKWFLCKIKEGQETVSI